jgi:predicted NBD/HSP70 family sugar kinase
MQTLWGIDLGGTKIEGVVMNASNHQVLARLRVPTQQQLGYEHILDQIKTLVSSLENTIGLKSNAVGFGTPGVLEPSSQTMKNSNTLCLNGMPLKADLMKKLNIPIEIANDANCFALAETTIGIVQDIKPNAAVVFGVIMGTGVGGGLVVNKNIINGLHGIGGEWGHNVSEEGGYGCYCGKNGCNEQVFSGTALERFYFEQSGTKRLLKEILERSQTGIDDVATATIKRLTSYFGKAISNVINVIDPDVIVLGGGVGNIDLLYTEGVEEAKKWIFNNCLDTLFLKPKLGDSAGVFGAAELARKHLLS